MSSEKILIIKHGALGDIIQGIDAYASIRAGHPDAWVTLLTTAPFTELARAMPFFDAIEIDPRSRSLHPMALLRMRAFFHTGWTRIYDLQSSMRTRNYFRLFVPKHVEFVGTHKGVSHPLPDMTGVNNRDRMVMAAQAGGCPEVMAEMNWLNAPKPAQAPSGKYAVLIAGCSPAKPEKRWHTKGFANLADALMAKGITPVLAGTDADRTAADSVLAQCQSTHQLTDLVGKTSILTLAGLLRDATLTVGNDTGPVFMAARFGTPTLMLMSHHTDPSMSAPYGERADWIRCCSLNDLSAEAVLEKVNALLKKTNQGLAKTQSSHR